MEAGLTIEIVDPDYDYLGLQISARNRRFSGSARVLASYEALPELASRIAGFPCGKQDDRTFEFGNLEGADGFCRLHFRCHDHAGHAFVDVFVKDAEFGEHAQIRLWTEAAAIDRFIDDLRRLQHDHSSLATLSVAE